MGSPAKRLLLTALAVLGVLGLLTGCASFVTDITPPPELLTPSVAPTVLAKSVYPLLPPDPVAGQALYADLCAGCHGLQGYGDGTQAASLSNPPAALADAQARRSVYPVDWYRVVMNGSEGGFMPGFGASLTDRQGWDVVAYAFSLGNDPAVLKQAAGFYAGPCAACHGEHGRGDGPHSDTLSTPPPDWANPARLAGVTDQDLYTAIREGITPDMPAYGEKIGRAQSWALADYVRSLGFAPDQAGAVLTPRSPDSSAPSKVGTPAVDDTQAGEPVSGTVQVSGTLTNASGGVVPSGMAVMLLGYKDQDPIVSLSAQAAADGSYVFKEVPLSPGLAIFVSSIYQEQVFQSEVIDASELKPGMVVNLPLEIYETSSDSSLLQIERAHILFDFQPGLVQVAELLLISNPSNKMIVPPASGEPLLVYDLPPGAANLQTQGDDDARFEKTKDGDLADRISIPAYSNQIGTMFTFELPYDGKQNFQISLPLATSFVMAALPAGGVHLESQQLQPSGERSMQGMSLNVYSASNLPSNTTLNLSLSGKPGATGLTAGGDRSLFIIVSLVVALIGLAGVWLYRNLRTPAMQTVTVHAEEALLDEIIDLDDAYRAGQIPEEAYRSRRETLKEQARRVLGK